MKYWALIMRFYDDIYSALFEWNLGLWNDELTAAWLTAGGLAGLLTVNVAFAAGIVVLFVGVVAPGPLTNAVALLVTVAIVVAEWRLFLFENRYSSIVERFRKKGVRERDRARLLAWAYLTSSIVAPLVFSMAMLYRE